MKLDAIVKKAVSVSGADFGFVLSRRGRLVTEAAPRDMPKSGRTAIVRRIDAQASGVLHLELPRCELVPFGGAAPVDVYVGFRGPAILCLVLATFASKDSVLLAMEEALLELESLLRRAARRGKASDVLPADRGRKARASSPPDIEVRQSSIGRRTMAEIERAELPLGLGRSSAPHIRVALASRSEVELDGAEGCDRQTLPFVEPAEDVKRAFDAAEAKRMGFGTVPPPARRPVTVERPAGVSRDSSIDAWHDALKSLDEAPNERRSKK